MRILHITSYRTQNQNKTQNTPDDIKQRVNFGIFFKAENEIAGALCKVAGCISAKDFLKGCEEIAKDFPEKLYQCFSKTLIANMLSTELSSDGLANVFLFPREKQAWSYAFTKAFDDFFTKDNQLLKTVSERFAKKICLAYEKSPISMQDIPELPQLVGFYVQIKCLENSFLKCQQDLFRHIRLKNE